MSRIDEALKRASQVPRRISGVTGSVADESHELREMTLEDYPLEMTRVSADPPPLRTAAFEPASPEAGSGLVAGDILARLSQNEKLVVSGDQGIIAREQYRRIAASLHEAQVAKGLKTVVVTSALPREGKTLTSINLALTLSESYGRRVLLIDADLRMPSVDQVLGLPNQKGLSDVLRADRVQLPAIAVSKLLDVLLSGRPEKEPLAGLSSNRMSALLEFATAHYDWVIVDTPPIALLSDAQLVAGMTQAVVFVIRAGSTPFPVVSKALDALGRDLVIGTVLNAVEGTALPAASYYGGYSKKKG
jgi:capsular exopolysaccharide synthesis family protein